MRRNEAIAMFGLKDNANSYDGVLAHIRAGFGLVFAWSWQASTA